MRKLFKWLGAQLKDGHNLIIFAIVTAVVSCEVGVPYILAVVTGDPYWGAIGSACWVFGLAPFTPFLPLCVVITLGVRKIIDKIKHKRADNTQGD